VTDPFVQVNIDLRQSELAAIREHAKAHGITMQAALRARLNSPSVESVQVAIELDQLARRSNHALRSMRAKQLAATNVGKPSKRKGREFPKTAVTSDPGKK
jgi:hypothetical protein